MKEKRIPVEGGIVTHNGVINEVILREPSVEMYLELGEIETIAKAPDGTLFWVENGATLRTYLERCLVQPKELLLIAQGGLKLGREVKEALLGFFQRETTAAEPSPTSPAT